MSSDSRDSEGNATSDRQWFATTHWSVVLSTGQGDSSQVAVAIDKLCHTYWLLLYGYIRRQGYGIDDAKDLTQAFFLQIARKKFLGAS